MKSNAPLLQLDPPTGMLLLDETLETGQAGTCDLFIHFSAGSAAFTLRERTTGKFLAMETLFDTEAGNALTPAVIRSCLQRSEVFGLNRHRKTSIAISNPYVTLIPSGLFREGDEQRLLQLAVHRDDLEAAATKVSGYDLHVIFGVTPEVRSVLRQLIPGCRITHSTTGELLYSRLRSSGKKPEAIYIVAHPDVVSLHYIKGKDLQFSNSFAVADTEEAMYFMLAACEQLDIDRHSISAELFGTGISCDALESRLSQFIPGLRLAGHDGFPTLSYKLNHAPASSQLPALTVSLCES